MDTGFDSRLYKPITITIDGTAASGKGTIVRGLQKNLDSRYKTLDAGLMYRALTFYYINQGIDDIDKLKLSGNLEKKLSEDIDLGFTESGAIILNNTQTDSSLLRGPTIDPYVARFSSLDEVKSFIVSRQKKLLLKVIMDGF